MGSKNNVSERLSQNGLKDFTLVQIDTINNRKGFDNELDRLCPNGIDFAFIDACHSYLGVSNDFFAIYPRLTPAGVIAFHDTLKIDGCRQFVFDLRTKYNDGTFDISDYPFGYGDRRCGVTLLTKRSYGVLPIGIDEICGSISDAHIIEHNDAEWRKSQVQIGNPVPTQFNGNVLVNKIGYYPSRKIFDAL
jgi:hypothetical protein